jgi:xylulokinase
MVSTPVPPRRSPRSNRQIGADRILATCGNALTSQSVGPKILWLKEERPELFARTAMVLTSTSYLVWKLTGEYVIDHYTAANFSPLYDVNRLDWTVELADFITLDRLPRLMWSTEIAGHVTAAAAAETGLAQGTPVTCGTIDAAAEAVSVGVQRPRRSDDDVWLDHLHHPGHRRPGARSAAVVCALAVCPGMHASMAGLSTSAR